MSWEQSQRAMEIRKTQQLRQLQDRLEAIEAANPDVAVRDLDLSANDWRLQPTGWHSTLTLTATQPLQQGQYIRLEPHIGYEFVGTGSLGEPIYDDVEPTSPPKPEVDYRLRTAKRQICLQ